MEDSTILEAYTMAVKALRKDGDGDG